jgi:hypothetical protein
LLDGLVAQQLFIEGGAGGGALHIEEDEVGRVHDDLLSLVTGAL